MGGFVPEDAGEDDNDEDDNDDNDKDMEDAEDDASTQPSPNICPSDQALHSCTTSPNIFAQVDNSAIHTAIHRQPDPRRFSLASSIPSTTTSPSIHPLNQASSHSNRHYSFSTVPSTVPSSALTSPALGPQRQQEDQEATEALLMLNSADRRSWSDLGKRGMSVKDLLSG